MKEFDWEDFSVENYQKIVGEDFIGEKINRGKEKIIFVKKGCEFLKDYAVLYRKDNFGGLETELHAYNGNEGDILITNKAIPYIKREIMGCAAKERDLYRKLSQLHKRRFENVKFEKIIGIEIPKESYDDIHYLYHTYSGGIELFGLSLKAPKRFRDEIENAIAKGMRELHKNTIAYGDPFPTNLRYNFDGKIICNPHNCIEIGKQVEYIPDAKIDYGSDNNDEIKHRTFLTSPDYNRDLAIIAYTHDWIEDLEGFLRKYYGDDIDRVNIKQKVEEIEENMKNIAEYGIPEIWISKGKARR